MVRFLDAIRTCARLAWWDGSSIDLGFRRFGDLAFGQEFGQEFGGEPVPARVRSAGERP